MNVRVPDFTEYERKRVVARGQGAVDGLIRQLCLEQVFSFKPGMSFEIPAP